MKTLRSSLSHLIAMLILSCLKTSLAEVVEPTGSSTVPIVPGSTSLISIPKATSVDLTRDFIPGLSSPTSISSNQPQEIIFITGCSTCESATDNTILPTVNVTNESPSSNQLSSSDLGAIIGGCAGGVVVIIIATVWLCIRRKRTRERNNAKFDIGPISRTSMAIDVISDSRDMKNHQPTIGQSISQNELKPRKNDKVYTINNNDSTIKRYNVSVGTETSDNQTPMTPPVILYMDAHNQQWQREEKCLVEEDEAIMPYNNMVQPRGRTVSQASKGARLSKYNFLSQAFSQMRSSYNGGDISHLPNMPSNSNDNKFEDQSISISSDIAAPQPTQNADHLYRDSMVLPYNKEKDISRKPASNTANSNQNYQMYSVHSPTNSNLDMNNSLTPPPGAPYSTSSSFHDPTRESTMTVGTLHAPLFHQQQNRQNPSPLPSQQQRKKKPYMSRLNVTPTFDRDSIKSDEVSKYSTLQQSPTMSSPTMSSPTDSYHKANNKPYPYF